VKPRGVTLLIYHLKTTGILYMSAPAQVSVGICATLEANALQFAGAKNLGVLDQGPIYTPDCIRLS
jgi:hypothetical protein